MNPKYWFVFDVESIGLHGAAFAFGFVVLDSEGKTVAEGLECCSMVGIWQYNGHPKEDRQWVADNVPDLEPTVRSEHALREAFWYHWREWKSKGAVMVADCPWPVESRFLVECVGDAPHARKWEGPYPLIDVASVLLAKGLDPMATYPRRENELPAHDPLNDARQSARLLKEALHGTN